MTPKSFFLTPNCLLHSGWLLLPSDYCALPRFPIVTSKSKPPLLNWLYSLCSTSWLQSSTNSFSLWTSHSTNHHICWVYCPKYPSGSSSTHPCGCCLHPNQHSFLPLTQSSGFFWAHFYSRATLLKCGSHHVLGHWKTLTGGLLLTGLAIGFVQQYWLFLELASCVLSLSHKLFYV